MKQFDIIVIGMGPAGMAVSAMGAAMGLSVLAVEKDKVGGECLNCGCIPSKALLKAAEALHGAKGLGAYGIDTTLALNASDPMRIASMVFSLQWGKTGTSPTSRPTSSPPPRPVSFSPPPPTTAVSSARTPRPDATSSPRPCPSSSGRSVWLDKTTAPPA